MREEGRSRQPSALHLPALSMPVRTANYQIGRPGGLRNGTGKNPEVLRFGGWMALRMRMHAIRKNNAPEEASST